MSNETTQKRSLSVSLGAAFLMATSAIGPGFLTQTSQFTAKYLSSFAFVIVCVIIMDMIAQTNVWSIVGVSGLRGQEIANKVLPGLGYLLVVLVVLGGLAFNIGNVGGVSLGFNAMIGIPEKAGVIIGGVLAICIFLSKKANDIVGKVAQILGGIIIVVMLVVAFMAKPPVGDAVVHIFTPENPKELIPVMVTLLGGSCGGYITFSGAHKLLDAGWGGKPEEVKHFRKSVLTGICVSGSVRILLFLCVLGVCTAGTVVVAENVTAVTSAATPQPRLSALLPATSATVSSVSHCSLPVSPPSLARPIPLSHSSRLFTPSSPRMTSGSSSALSPSPRSLWQFLVVQSAWSS